jgi:TPR repeat protein
MRAERSDADAMNALGVAYSKGDGVPKDAATARVWFRQGANLGHVAAMNNLAYFYEQGLGGGYDSKAAIKWYIEAADRGNANAMWNLAVIYEENTPSVPRESVQSARYLLLAIRKGSEVARTRTFSGLPTWSVTTRVAVQEKLRNEGYYTGVMTGTFDAETYRALQKYEKMVSE